ncbi:hypothetical protein [Arthrobacter sp. NA-172]|uniref:hypothetical protein n=1 Tax=Arthrobacter sp. NA-172 TaxID=3367524 RepID=UPI00375450BF
MSNTTKTGHVTVSILAGPIEATGNESESGRHQIWMANGLAFIHITPDVARQWIGVLEPIAKAAE